MAVLSNPANILSGLPSSGISSGEQISSRITTCKKVLTLGKRVLVVLVRPKQVRLPICQHHRMVEAALNIQYLLFFGKVAEDLLGVLQLLCGEGVLGALRPFVAAHPI